MIIFPTKTFMSLLDGIEVNSEEGFHEVSYRIMSTIVVVLQYDKIHLENIIIMHLYQNPSLNEIEIETRRPFVADIC